MFVFSKSVVRYFANRHTSRYMFAHSHESYRDCDTTWSVFSAGLNKIKFKNKPNRYLTSEKF